VNDGFVGYIIRFLGDDFERRFRHSSKEIVKGFEILFIQFPNFTYIKIEGFSRRPYRLPRYPNEKRIILELTR
jgi:hypothetical protein